jgi:hypothetical protein
LFLAICTSITFYSAHTFVLRANQWCLFILWYHPWCSLHSWPHILTPWAMITTHPSPKMAKDCWKTSFLAIEITPMTGTTSHNFLRLKFIFLGFHSIYITNSQLTCSYQNTRTKRVKRGESVRPSDHTPGTMDFYQRQVWCEGRQLLTWFSIPGMMSELGSNQKQKIPVANSEKKSFFSSLW